MKVTAKGRRRSNMRPIYNKMVLHLVLGATICLSLAGSFYRSAVAWAVLPEPSLAEKRPSWRENKACGPIAVYILLRLHGCKNTSYDSVLSSLPLSEKGSNLYDLAKCCTSFGITARVEKVPSESLYSTSFPIIAYLKTNNDNLGKYYFGHFVVVLGADGKKIRILDPSMAIQPIEVDLREFSMVYSGYCICRAPDLLTRSGLLVDGYVGSLRLHSLSHQIWQICGPSDVGGDSSPW